MLSEHTLQIDYFILESSGLQWTSIKLILKNPKHTHAATNPTQPASNPAEKEWMGKTKSKQFDLLEKFCLLLNW